MFQALSTLVCACFYVSFRVCSRASSRARNAAVTGPLTSARRVVGIRAAHQTTASKRAAMVDGGAAAVPRRTERNAAVRVFDNCASLRMLPVSAPIFMGMPMADGGGFLHVCLARDQWARILVGG